MGSVPVLISIQSEREFAALCRHVLMRAELPADPRFSSNAARCENSAELDEIIGREFTALPRDELLLRLRTAGIAHGEVNDVAGLARHPALRKINVPTPAGDVECIAPPAFFNGAPRELRPVPALGAHTESVRREFEC